MLNYGSEEYYDKLHELEDKGYFDDYGEYWINEYEEMEDEEYEHL